MAARKPFDVTVDALPVMKMVGFGSSTMTGGLCSSFDDDDPSYGELHPDLDLFFDDENKVLSDLDFPFDHDGEDDEIQMDPDYIDNDNDDAFFEADPDYLFDPDNEPPILADQDFLCDDDEPIEIDHDFYGEEESLEFKSTLETTKKYNYDKPISTLETEPSADGKKEPRPTERLVFVVPSMIHSSSTIYLVAFGFTQQFSSLAGAPRRNMDLQEASLLTWTETGEAATVKKSKKKRSTDSSFLSSGPSNKKNTTTTPLRATLPANDNTIQRSNNNNKNKKHCAGFSSIESTLPSQRLYIHQRSSSTGTGTFE
ncbi:hypothetical protein SEMRO_1954_G307650.1 [Seminavis robusta]|uniref:Uncharacterized protein n=1 Tax=Seminavis robusta TaxID=568900 RepID=A0A9N8EVM0_9STRA|nr:hypothetical protein SEMRO_1954_G307650.1 [Seminavis robusta]|eukprot:Sro1954_g307650.1 n/a (313) ;mRNA; r:15343-16970